MTLMWCPFLELWRNNFINEEWPSRIVKRNEDARGKFEYMYDVVPKCLGCNLR